jgi:hypothetical protein
VGGTIGPYGYAASNHPYGHYPFFPYHHHYDVHAAQYGSRAPPSASSNGSQSNLNGQLSPIPWKYDVHAGRDSKDAAKTKNGDFKTPLAKTREDDMLAGCSFDSARKSIFDDSPRSIGGGSLTMNLESSPTNMSIQGMTPPMSNLRGTFSTPVPADAALSTREAYNLNKALFECENHRCEPHITPGSFYNVSAIPPCQNHTVPPPQLRFSLGSSAELGAEISNMRISNRVSISPIKKDDLTSSAGEAGCSAVLAVGMSVCKSATPNPLLSDVEMMPPPTAPRFRDVPPLMSSGAQTPAYVSQDCGSSRKRPSNDSSMVGRRTPATLLVKSLSDMTPSTAASTHYGDEDPRTDSKLLWSNSFRLSPVPMSPYQMTMGAFRTSEETGSHVSTSAQSPQMKRRRTLPADLQMMN